MLRPACWFTCPWTHLSWILLWNQIWTLPCRVEDPLKHDLTISATLFRITFQWLPSIQNRCIPHFLWDPPPYFFPYSSAQCSSLLICILPILPALTQVLVSLGNLPPEVFLFLITWFSSSASGVWDLPEAAKERHRGSSLFTPVPLGLSYIFLFGTQEFSFKRASCSPSWQSLGISGWCCWWGSLALGCWLRSKTPYRWLTYKNQNADVFI